MSQDTKRADPQTHTSVQHKPKQFSGAQHPASCKFELSNKGISDPLAKQPSPLKLELTQVAFKNGVGKLLRQFAHPRENQHCSLDAIWLAWCLHEVRQWRREFIAVVFRVASCISAVRLTTCRNEHRHAMEVAFAKILAEATLRWPIQRISSVGRMIIYTCVGTLGNA